MREIDKKKLELDLMTRVPFGVKVLNSAGAWSLVYGKHGQFSGFKYGVTVYEAINCKLSPIYHPLSNLNKEITLSNFNGGKPFIPFQFFDFDSENPVVHIEQDRGNVELMKQIQVVIDKNDEFHLQFLPFWVVELFKQWQFDINGLIIHGLAVDINTLKENPYVQG